jgi:predicted N-formylglutamate amidohydrolase
VLSCEHASARLPRAYQGLGVPRAARLDHIGWDIGAHARAARDRAPPRRARGCVALVAAADRLQPRAVRPEPDRRAERRRGGAGERQAGSRGATRRIALYHAPYHAALDRTVARAKRRSDGEVQLLALHSFTPVMAGVERRFDIGVLFDAYPVLARQLGRELSRLGYRVRYNEPYSGMAGLIYSARRHGNAAGSSTSSSRSTTRSAQQPRSTVGRESRRAHRAGRRMTDAEPHVAGAASLVSLRVTPGQGRRAPGSLVLVRGDVDLGLSLDALRVLAPQSADVVSAPSRRCATGSCRSTCGDPSPKSHSQVTAPVASSIVEVNLTASGVAFVRIASAST